MPHDVVVRGNCGLVFDELVQYRILVVGDRGLQRDGFLSCLENLGDLGHRGLQLLRQLVHAGFASHALRQLIRSLQHPVHGLDHMDRDPDGPSLIRDRTGDTLTNPPGRIGGKLVAQAIVELVDGLHQPDVSFLDQVKQIEARIRIVLRDAEHQPQIGADKLVLGPGHLRLVFVDQVDDLAQLAGVRQILGFQGSAAGPGGANAARGLFCRSPGHAADLLAPLHPVQHILQAAHEVIDLVFGELDLRERLKNRLAAMPDFGKLFGAAAGADSLALHVELHLAITLFEPLEPLHDAADLLFASAIALLQRHLALSFVLDLRAVGRHCALDHGSRLQLRAQLHQSGRADRGQGKESKRIDLGRLDLFRQVDLLLTRKQRNFAHASIVNIERIRRRSRFPLDHRPVLRGHAAETYTIDVVGPGHTGKLIVGSGFFFHIARIVEIRALRDFIFF